MKRPKPPCGRDCPMRHVGCHGECPPYMSYEAENHKCREERRKKQQTSDAINQIKNHCIRSVTHSMVKDGTRKYQ